jgi:predicted dienelactone hydrolase
MLTDPKFGHAHRQEPRIRSGPFRGRRDSSSCSAGGQFSGEEIAKFCQSPTTARDSSCEPRQLIAKSIAEIEELRKHDPAVQASLARAKRSYRDERIRAVVAMAPAIGPAFTVSTLHAIATPVFIVTAREDAITPPATERVRYARFSPDARLLTVPGNANHFTFGSDCTDEGRRALESCRETAQGPTAHRYTPLRRTTSAEVLRQATRSRCNPGDDREDRAGVEDLPEAEARAIAASVPL